MIYMTYQHKKAQCIKETRDILIKHVMEIKKSEYAIIEKDESEECDESDESSDDTNVLHSDENPSTDNLEEYSPPNQVKFEPAEAKESFEKKKKKRNYIEFKGK
jgi:hypothetical protein